jgi:Ca-activated chloride channel family protein
MKVACFAAVLLLGFAFLVTHITGQIKIPKAAINRPSLMREVYRNKKPQRDFSTSNRSSHWNKDTTIYSVGNSHSLSSDEVFVRTQSLAHGGTVPPNNDPVDAMFFENYGTNPFIDTEDDHLSTMAADVDTASYTVVRSYLQDGHRPPKDSVRVEEFINYMDYAYPDPHEGVFAVHMEASPWPFGGIRKNSCLLRIGLKAREISPEYRKTAILTFVIDLSSSMNRENRIGLVKKSLRMLVDQLRSDDQIGIVVYGSRGRKVLDHTRLTHKSDILSAIDSLRTGGSTNAEEGITIGYTMADQAFEPGKINRVILCSDGVANVGLTGAEEILEFIRAKVQKGITLSTLGFGMGNYNDVLMEKLGNKGDGHYAYVDTINEAKRLFSQDLTSFLQIVARDVKIQIDFNPDVVRSYRLIGYENRDVPDAKFRDDTQDGGEVGAGHSVTSLYEIKLWKDKSGLVATTHVRYQDADTRVTAELNMQMETDEIHEDFTQSSRSFRLAATVAEFAEILRESYWARSINMKDVLAHAQKLSWEYGSNHDLIELVDLIAKAKDLMSANSSNAPKRIEDETSDR